jgi:hypothetical protein
MQLNIGVLAADHRNQVTQASQESARHAARFRPMPSRGRPQLDHLSEFGFERTSEIHDSRAVMSHSGLRGSVQGPFSLALSVGFFGRR